MRCSRSWLAIVVGLGAAGCPATPPSLPSPGLGTTDGSGGDFGSTSVTGEDAGTSGDAASTGDAEASASDDGGSATGDTTGGGDDGPVSSCGGSPQTCASPSPYGGPGTCDPFAQDCPAGQKCMPVGPSGSWESTACRPLQNAVAKLGEACTILGETGSGSDDCDVGLMCWSVDGGMRGTCIELCGCGPNAPTCSVAGSACVQANDGALPLCLPTCDPTQQDCPPGEGCYPNVDGSNFACAPDATAAPTMIGDACAFINACSPGQFCVGAGFVPGCDDPVGCCAQVCDTNDPAPCAEPSSRCVPWFPVDGEPTACPTVGVCGTPD